MLQTTIVVYWCLQILPGLDLDDIDLEVDEDEGPVDRPQAGEFADEPSCIRKEYRQLTQTEVDNFQSAMRTLKASGDYDTLVAYHHQSQSPAAHFGVAFLFWHLRYLILYVGLFCLMRLHYRRNTAYSALQYDNILTVHEFLRASCFRP